MPCLDRSRGWNRIEFAIVSPKFESEVERLSLPILSDGTVDGVKHGKRPRG